MSSYGRVISGGSQMTKGLCKPINDKREARASEDSRRAEVASAVRDAYTVNTLSSQHTNNVKEGGKFTKPKVSSNP